MSTTVSDIFFCDNCNDIRSEQKCFFYEERLYCIRCGQETEERCSECDNSGWVQVHSERPPAFGECPKCYNQYDKLSP